MNVRYQIMTEVSNADVLAFAKSKSRRLIEGKLESFTRDWIYRGVDVRVRCVPLGDVDETYLVKIWVGDPVGEYWYSSNIPSPCTACVGIEVIVDAKTGSAPSTIAPPQTISVPTVLSATGHFFFSSGPVFCDPENNNLSYSVVTEVWTWVGGGGSFTATTFADLGQVGVIGSYNGFPIFGAGSLVIGTMSGGVQFGVQDCTGTTVPHTESTSQSLFPPTSVPNPAYATWNAAWAAWNADTATDQIYVYTTDGDLLGSKPITRNPTTGAATNLPKSEPWSGGGFIRLQDNSFIEFDLPDNACFTPANPPGLTISTSESGVPTERAQVVTFAGPGGVFTSNGSKIGDSKLTRLNNYYNLNGDGLVRSGSFGTNLVPPGQAVPSDIMTTFNGTIVLVSSLSAYQQAADYPEWINAQREGAERERARRKNCSDNFVANLTAGAFDVFHPYIRSGHPVSSKTHMPPAPKLMVATISDEVEVISADETITTKTVVLTYSYVSTNGVTEQKQSTIVGTKRVVIARLANSKGVPNSSSYTTTTYDNWLDISTQGKNNTAPVLDFDFMFDTTSGICQIWNGDVVAGAATFSATLDSFKKPFVPEKPYSSDNRVASYPQIYRDYRNHHAPLIDSQSGNPSWRDSTFRDDEVVDVYLLMHRSSVFGELGMFPHANDLLVARQYVDRVYRFKYNYEDGSFTFQGVKYSCVLDASGRPTFENLFITYNSAINVVIRSVTRPWEDLKTNPYGTQLKRLVAEVPSPPLNALETTFKELRGGAFAIKP